VPIGIVSEDDFLAELESLNPKRKDERERTRARIELPTDQNHGRNKGDTNVPDSLRKIIGEESVINGRSAGLDLANEFGISASSVSAYAKGASSTASYNNPTLDKVRFLNKSRARAVKKATRTLNLALGSIDQEKLDYADAKDLAGIAKDMSVIIKNLEPQAEPTNQSIEQNQQFVIFAPQFRSEKEFDVIDVTESDLK